MTELIFLVAETPEGGYTARALGDTTTLADPSVVASLKEKYTEEG